MLATWVAVLQQVDLELENGEQGDFELIIAGVQSLLSEEGAEPLSKFAETTVHAVAGIGHPQRFFDALLLAGLRIIPHAFPDHHKFDAQDIKFNDDYPVLMTAKDAVKCQQFAGQKHYFVPVVAQVKAETVARLDQLIESLPRAAK